MVDKRLEYHIITMSNGFMAKCNINSEISIFAKTKEEALKKIDLAISEHKKVFSEKGV